MPVLQTHPFESRRETSSTTASKTRGLDLADDPVVTLEENLLGLVPVAHLFRMLKVGRVTAVEVLEDAILVLEAAVVAYGIGRAILDGRKGSALLDGGAREGPGRRLGGRRGT